MAPSQTLNVHHQSVELIERFAQCLLNDCKNKEDYEAVQQLAPYIGYFSSEIELNKKRDQVFESFVNMIDSTSEKLDPNLTLKEFTDELEKVKKQCSNFDKCEKYVSFMDMISEYNVENADDSEIKAISQTVSTIDPISKKPINEPVKNKKCGHVYDKDSVLQLIAQNPRTRCPIPGCSATDFVKKSDLVPDNALKRMLINAKTNSQKKLKTQE